VVAVNIPKLEEARKRKGLTKKALAELAGITPAAYTFIIQGKHANPPTIKLLFEAVGLDPEKAWKKERKSA
jgi:transcriptional regulator with XRE-family HTH domain